MLLGTWEGWYKCLIEDSTVVSFCVNQSWRTAKTSFLTKPESSTGLCLNASLKRQFYLLSIQWSSGLSTRAHDLPSHSSDQFYSPRTKGPIGKQSGGQCCTSGHILCDNLIMSRIYSGDGGGWCWLFPPAAAPHFWCSGCSSTRSTVSCSVPVFLLCAHSQTMCFFSNRIWVLLILSGK